MKMTSVDVEPVESTVLRIYIPKAKAWIEMDTAKLQNHVYQELLVLGGKAATTRGMTTITKEKFPDPDELQAAALAKAEANLADLYAGKITIRGASKDSKVSREVMKVARDMARKRVREFMKRRGIKITQVKSSEITKAANLMLASEPAIIERAKKELDELEKEDISLDMDIEVDPNLVAAQAKRKGAKTLSATQAGKVTGRVTRQ
jgi:hypothetical protein